MWWDCHPTGHWWSNPIGLQIWKSSQHATFHLAALECFTNKWHQRTMEAWTSATKHFGKPSGSTGGSSFASCPPAPMEHAILAAPSNLNLRPAGIHRLCLKFQSITRCTWTRCRLTEIWKNICRCKTPCADLVQPSQCTGKLQSIWKLQSIFHSFNFYNKCWWFSNKTAPTVNAWNWDPGKFQHPGWHGSGQVARPKVAWPKTFEVHTDAAKTSAESPGLLGTRHSLGPFWVSTVQWIFLCHSLSVH